jgi:hypothetical protein
MGAQMLLGFLCVNYAVPGFTLLLAAIFTGGWLVFFGIIAGPLYVLDALKKRKISTMPREPLRLRSMALAFGLIVFAFMVGPDSAAAFCAVFVVLPAIGIFNTIRLAIQEARRTATHS